MSRIEKPGQIGIVGNGSWGTALAKMLTDNGQTIRWWVRGLETAKSLAQHHHNPKYLSSVRFEPKSLLPTTDIEEVLHYCDTVVFAVPSAYATGVLQQASPEAWRDKVIISAIKGILPDCGQLLNNYLHAFCGHKLADYIAITGPCHAEEVAQERLSYLTFSGTRSDITESVSQAFATRYIHTHHNHDVWGAQFAAVLKNIYAVGAGIAHGLDYGDNFLSVYITACFREMYRFVKKHFRMAQPEGKPPDFLTSAYMGDLLVTCYSLHSRNRAFGMMVGKGYSVKAAQLEMNMVAEGYYASRGMQQVSKEMAIKMPLASIIYKILWEDLSPRAGFQKMEERLQ